MDLSALKTGAGARKRQKRVGRGPGSGHGKTSGKGHKGQRARSGYSRRQGFEGGQMPLNRRLPKRGFYHYDRHAHAIVNVDVLARVFDSGAEVTPETLFERGLADPLPGGIKVLGRGELAKRLIVKAHAFSPSARAKIESAGGTVELIPLPGARPARNVAAASVAPAQGQAQPAEE